MGVSVSRKWQRISVQGENADSPMPCRQAKLYVYDRVAVFLIHVLTCMTGSNLISESLDCAPPCVSFEEIPEGDVFAVNTRLGG